MAQDALSVALQHPAVAADQQNICRLLQVCKAWRRSVQQSTGGLTHVNLKKYSVYHGDVVTDLATDMAQLGHWLTSNAGTVRSLELYTNLKATADDDTVDGIRAMLQQVLALGLKAAATAHAQLSGLKNDSTADMVPSAAATAPAPALRLRGFTCSSDLVSPVVLSALPTATLTQLYITVPKGVPIQAAVSRLTNLQSLTLLDDDERPDDSLDEYLSTISHLTTLTELSLHSVRDTSGLALLPEQLRVLELTIGQMWHEPATFTLVHLTQLQELSLSVNRPVRSSALPHQLQQLHITCCRNVDMLSHLNIASLQELQQLIVENSADQFEELLLLKQLPQLEAVELGYYSSAHALLAAPAWPQLQQLSGLQFMLSCSPVQMATILNAVYPLRHLTKLEIACNPHADDAELEDLFDDVDDEEDDVTSEWGLMEIRSVCRSLKQLTQLGNLVLDLSDWGPYDENDILHLSALSCLTALHLNHSAGLNDTVLSAVLLELTGLQRLSLYGLQHTHALPVIGKLHGLTELYIGDNQLPQQEQLHGLKYLTGLRKLKSLYGFHKCGKAALEQFWADLRA